jgi:sugar lactone lactonase YvrE
MKQVKIPLCHDRCKDCCSSLARAACFLTLVFLLTVSAPSLNWDAPDNFVRIKPAQAGQASAPDLTVSSVSNPPSTAIIGGSFSVTDTTRNAGNATAGASTTRYRLSSDSTISSSDPLLTGSRSIASLSKGATSTGSVAVTVPNGLSAGTYYLGACADDLTVVAEANETNNCRASTTTVTVFGAPVIDLVNPASGTIGTSITISGSNFGAVQGSSTVTFNGITATPTSWTNTSILAPVPAEATSGPVVVTVGGVASNGVNFSLPGISYIYDPLGRLRAVSDPASDTAIYNYDAVGNVLSISRQSSSTISVIEFAPKAGPSGTSVTIHGTGFGATASQNTVTFNGAPAAVISSTTTQILTSVPAGAATGPIGVTSPAGPATSTEPFVIASTAPLISGFAPMMALAGTSLTISGSNFDAMPANNRVKFNDRKVAWVSSGSPTSLPITIPSGSTSGRVSVITPEGRATSTDDLFIPPSPYQLSHIESTGRTAIGQNLQVNINNPEKISLVLFDGTAGQQIKLVVGNVTVSPQAFMRIYNPDGSILASNLVGTSGATVGPYLLSMTGTHQILIAARIITTIAGTGGGGSSGDNGPAVNAMINTPEGVAYDSQGNLFIAEYFGQRVRKVNPSGIITTVAGTGTAGYTGDGGKAVKAQLYYPNGLAVDALGNLFIADFGNRRIRKVTPAGIISTVAGTGLSGYNGDGIPATSANIYPTDVAVDTLGNLLIVEDSHSRIRKVDTSGIISTVAGTGLWPYNGDGIPATQANINPERVTFDNQGNFYISESTNTYRVRKVDTSGIITTIVGTGAGFYNGENLPARSINTYPSGLKFDSQGNLFIAEGFHRIRKVDSNNFVTSVAGTGDPVGSFNGDGIPAVMANLSVPDIITFTPQGDLVFSDAGNNRVRKIQNTSPGTLTLSLTSP